MDATVVVDVTDVGSGPVVTEIEGTVDVGAGPVAVGATPPVVVEIAVWAGNESSVCSSSPPVKITRATMPRTTATAPAARAMRAPGWFHHPPGGGSYSGSNSDPGPKSVPSDPPPPPGGGGGTTCVGSDGPCGPWSLTSGHLSRGVYRDDFGRLRLCRTRRLILVSWFDEEALVTVCGVSAVRPVLRSRSEAVERCHPTCTRRRRSRGPATRCVVGRHGHGRWGWSVRDDPTPR